MSSNSINPSDAADTAQDVDFTQDMGDINYGLIVFVCVLIIVILVTFISFICTRIHLQGEQWPPISRGSMTVMQSAGDQRRQQRQQLQLHNMDPIIAINMGGMGLDEATLRSFPKLLYSQAKIRSNNHKDTPTDAAAAAHHNQSTASSSCCSICLGDYKENDILRLLPDCGHLFHLKCVDPWLRLRSTCPICRSSPVPSPLAGGTPLAEVAPLARSMRV